MHYKRFTEQSDQPAWGGVTCFFEVDASNVPIRQVLVYENGKTFTYDLDSAADEGGGLYGKPLFATKAARREWRMCKIRESVFAKAWDDPKSVSADFYGDVIGSLRSVSTWSLVLAVGLLVLTPVVTYYLYYKNPVSTDEALSYYEFLVTSLISVVFGLFLINRSLVVRRATKQTLDAANKAAQTIGLLTVGAAVMALVAGGGGLGIVGLIVVLKTGGAVRKLAQAGSIVSTAYRLKVLAGAFAVLGVFAVLFAAENL